MIGYYRMSIIGRSHLSEEGGVCQDSSGVITLPNGWVVAAIADGLGSAKHSDTGSRIAVNEVLRFVGENIPEQWHDESLISLLRIAYHSAMKLIKEAASNENNAIKDYDTTLTSIIYNGTNAVFAHVGDGGIIALNPYGEYSLLTIAQKGDEFNTVSPLRSGPDKWMFGISNESIASLLLLTDGIYDIACPWLLAKQDQKIYLNYIRPFMDKNLLPVETEEDFLNAEKEITAEFFNGDHARQITDDKTILGIINTDILPEVKSDEYYTEPDWRKLQDDHREKLYGNKINITNNKNSEITVDIEPLKEGYNENNQLLTEIKIKLERFTNNLFAKTFKRNK